MMHPIHAIVLGIVEGVTEYLPISSTGHLILASAAMGLNEPESLKQAVSTFNIVIQGGAILAIVTLYWPRLMQMLRGLLGRDDAGRRLLINLAIAFAPAMLTWPILYPLTKDLLFQPIPVLAALLLGGIWMIWIDRWRAKEFADDTQPADDTKPAANAEPATGIELDQITPKLALGIGLFQWASLWPGTSRAMMTIAGGMMLGLRPKAAAEFSFLLGLPTIGAACVYEAFGVYKASRAAAAIEQLAATSPATDPTETVASAEAFFTAIPPLTAAIGFITSAVVAAVVVKWFVGFLERRGLAFFGWYRIALCAVMAGLLLAGVITL